MRLPRGPNLNWLPPEQVAALIIQVLEKVVDGESDDVKYRVALKAKEMTSIIIPRLHTNEPIQIPEYVRTPEVNEALKTVEKYSRDWTAIPKVSGYVNEMPEPPSKIPNYKKNHPYLNGLSDDIKQSRKNKKEKNNEPEKTN